MILVAPEGVELETLKVRPRPVEQPAMLGDFPEEEGVRVIEDREIHLVVGKEMLQLMEESGVLRRGYAGSLEQHPEIDVAARMDLSGDRRPELHQQANPVCTRDPVEVGVGSHSADYTGDRADTPGSAFSLPHETFRECPRQ